MGEKHKFQLNNVQIVSSLIRTRYNEDVLTTFRKYEESYTKQQRLQIDIEFLKDCRDHDLVPVFLQFKLSQPRLQKDKDVRRLWQRLYKKEIAIKES